MTNMMFDAPAEKTENVSAPVVATEPTVVNSEVPEPKSALALGLPTWSIEPPVIAVRRKVRSI